MFQFTDRLVLDDAAQVRETADGYLTAAPRVARTGIQLYRGSEVGMPSKPVVKIYRPESEVFKHDSMWGFAHRPMTNDHPPVQVNASNWKDYAVGQAGAEVARDGVFIRVPMVLMDKKAVDDFKAGKAELSVGYTCDIKWEPGKTDDGQDYDGIQTNISPNHIAVVKAARGGPELRIGDQATQWVECLDANAVNPPAQTDPQPKKDTTNMADAIANLKNVLIDGISVQMSDTADQVVQRHIKALMDSVASEKKAKEEAAAAAAEEKKTKDAAIADLTTKLAQADAKVATLEKQVADAAITPAKLDALVADRKVVADKARAVLGDANVVVDGKTDADIRRQVVSAKLGDVAKDWSDDQVKVSFDTLTATVDLKAVNGGNRPGGFNDMARAFSTPPASAMSDSAKLYDARDKKLTEAWKN